MILVAKYGRTGTVNFGRYKSSVAQKFFYCVQFPLSINEAWVLVKCKYTIATLTLCKIQMGLSEIEVGAIFGAMSASYFLSSLPAGHLTDRFVSSLH